MKISAKLKDRYDKPHLSYSSVKNALSDMAQFDRYMKGELKFRSDALDFGTLYDMLLFEREKAMRIPEEVRHDRAVKMGRGSTKAKGLRTWDELIDPETGLNEEETVMFLALGIKRQTGRAMGNPNYPRVHQELEKRFLPLRGYGRKVGSMRMKVLRMAKELGIEL